MHAFHVKSQILYLAVLETERSYTVARPGMSSGVHGRLLCKTRRHIKILGLLKGSFLCDLQPVDAVYTEFCDLLPVFVKAYEIVGIVIPE